MKILHILNTPRAEGTPNLVLDWLGTGLHEQEVYVLHRDPADLTPLLKERSKWYGENHLFDYGLSKFPRIALAVREVCARQKPDLVICWPAGFANWVSLGAKLAGVKHLLVHAGNPAGTGPRAEWMSRYLMWPLWALGGKLVCCSNYVRQTLLDIPFLPTHIFYTQWNGVNLSRFAKEERRVPESPLAVMVANLECARDHESAILAAKIVLETYPDFQLHFIGRGSKFQALSDLIEAHHLAANVKLLGAREDVPTRMANASMLILSTLEEGFGTVLIEALACGLPIVATDVPACHEVLENGKWGRIVPIKNPEAMASAILETLKHPLTDEEMEARRAYAAEFSILNMMQGYLNLLD